MTEQNIKKIISYLNTQMILEVPSWFEYLKHRTVPKYAYWTIEILNENERSNNVYETDLIALTIYSPALKWPFALVPISDKLKEVLYWPQKILDWFKTYNIDQLWRLDEISSRWFYKITFTINISYAK